jgi:hypothetical protein
MPHRDRTHHGRRSSASALTKGIDHADDDDANGCDLESDSQILDDIEDPANETRFPLGFHTMTLPPTRMRATRRLG